MQVFGSFGGAGTVFETWDELMLKLRRKRLYFAVSRVPQMAVANS
jgi:hypothetical protein